MSGFDHDVVAAVLEDHQTAPIDARLRDVLGLLQKLTLEPQELGPDDIEPLLTAGLEPPAIRDAMYVAFVFNVIDRLADTFDFAVHDAKHQARTATFLWLFGYWSAALPA